MPSPRVAIAAPGREPVQAAIEVVADGGNAVDAAVTAILVATVTEPGIVSPMSGAFVNIWAPGGEPLVIDGNVEMPGRGRPDERFRRGIREIFIDFYGGITLFAGHGSVATPGMFAAVSEANARFGSAPWARLVEPAAHYARSGYSLGQSAASYLRDAFPLFDHHDATRAFVLQGGGPAVTGQIMRSPDLANTMEVIARDGVATLYGGELGEVVGADMDANEGLLSREDLAAYRTVTRPALRSRLGDWDIGVNPAPSIGGPVLTAMLRMLGQRRLEAGVSHAGDVIDIQRRVLEYRRRSIDQAHDLGEAGRELIDTLERLGPAGLDAVSTSSETIHVSAVDADGLACSITSSSGYGSGITAPGTGLILNNALGEPELNRRGLHALPVGTRLASNMAPSTARHGGGAVLAVGSPGADRITTALFQVLGGVCLDGHPLQQAIDAPRVHVAIEDDGSPRLHYEASQVLAEAVAATGLPSVEHPPLAMFFGGVGVAARHDDGRLDAAGDPRREAATAVG
ncbi:gamma-glutamyltranspeptidase/glutathione hydrolase [Kineosphaera limosa]|uniref:Gamma-glutamyltranspeptidase n=1 Tax=Kineosphaera limosa NBRC 100340 TaxID=1184609 RepID=K6VHJ2_9MICO|nr:gamma-glutamyltransferase [Kineosphaera limosa]NYD99570.1 gamma-glutamyltranspeptidase/glutathione hydrolase [Kineosphaera limosa]GAB95673.1 gamma-glutamyltranspeptidase [Kineosphaera limosa NBRC 100340]